ncbi:putative phosphatase [compost metagenome]
MATLLRYRDRKTVERRLLELGLAGETPNTPSANLRAIRQMRDGNVFYTFGIEAVSRAMASGRFDEEAILTLMARACGQESAEAFLDGNGTIAPASSLKGLERGAELMRRAIAIQGTVAFGTGHPGSLLNAYNRLADYLDYQGCTIAQVAPGAAVGVDWVLDFVGRVAVTSDTCGVLHGHSTRPMEQFLKAYGHTVNLVIGDHGHAGAALNAGLATLGLMDTNDPALMMAAYLGMPDFVAIPLFDNRPNAVSQELADLWIHLIEHPATRAEGARARVTFDR